MEFEMSLGMFMSGSTQLMPHMQTPTVFSFYFDLQFQQFVRYDFQGFNDPTQGAVGVTALIMPTSST